MLIKTYVNMIKPIEYSPGAAMQMMGEMKMKKVYYSVEKEGFYGAYFESKDPLNRCMIAMLGDAIDDRMAVSAVKWLHHRGCNVMTMSPAKKDYGHHNYPLERIERAIEAIKSIGNR